MVFVSGNDDETKINGALSTDDNFSYLRDETRYKKRAEREDCLWKLPMGGWMTIVWPANKKPKTEKGGMYTADNEKDRQIS